MSIQDFHSKLLSGESSVLFEALRHLRRLEDVQSLLFREESTAGGWNPWTDAPEHHRHAVAKA